MSSLLVIKSKLTSYYLLFLISVPLGTMAYAGSSDPNQAPPAPSNITVADATPFDKYIDYSEAKDKATLIWNITHLGTADVDPPETIGSPKPVVDAANKFRDQIEKTAITMSTPKPLPIGNPVANLPGGDQW